jgi:hypothetical protein
MYEAQVAVLQTCTSRCALSSIAAIWVAGPCPESARRVGAGLLTRDLVDWYFHIVPGVILVTAYGITRK